VVDHKVQVASPLPSPVQLPHIEQLEPIGTDISSEIQFQQMNGDKVATEEKDDPYKSENTPNDDHHEERPVDHHEERSVDHHRIVAEEEDQQNKKDHPKRSSLLLKFLFPKRTSEQDAVEEPPEEPGKAEEKKGSLLSLCVLLFRENSCMIQLPPLTLYFFFFFALFRSCFSGGTQPSSFSFRSPSQCFTIPHSRPERETRQVGAFGGS
jgi:hypothetical protein